MKEFNPPIEITTSPSITDIIDFDYVEESHPEYIEEYCEERNKRKEDLTDDDKERIIIDRYQDDTLLYEMHWEDSISYLDELLNENKFKKGKTYRVSGMNMGWQKRSGHRDIQFSNADHIVSLFSGSDFTMRIHKIDKEYMEFSVATHDGTGSYKMEKIKKSEANDVHTERKRFEFWGITFYGSQIDIDKSVENMKEYFFIKGIDGINGVKQNEVEVRIDLQKLIDKGKIKTDITYLGNSVYSFKRLKKDFKYFIDSSYEDMSDYLYQFFHLTHGIAHTNKYGWIANHNCSYSLSKYLNDATKSVPRWKEDSIRILKYMTNYLNKKR